MASNYDHDSVKRLYRSRDDSMIAGVCGGIAKYLNLDSTLIRVIWVVFCLFYLVGVIIYIILYLMIPLEPQ